MGEIVALATGMGYILFTMMNSFFVGNKYYILLLYSGKHYGWNMLAALFLAAFGIFRMKSGHAVEALYATPFMFLVLLKLLNYGILKLYGRYVLLVLRNDHESADPAFRVRFADRCVLILLLWLPPLLALLLIKLLA